MAITNFGQLTTPEQYTTYYFEQLKTELESLDLSLNKVGLVGLILHITGNLQFDTKRYYDGLFKEAFPIAAVNDSNLAQHAITFNYANKLAQAAIINGTLQFNFATLPQKLSGVVKRELIFNNISFTVGNLTFTLLSQNIIRIDTIDNVDYYRITIVDKENVQYIYPVSPQYTQVGIINCEQVSFDEYTYTVPNYSYNSYYQIEVDLTDLFISDLIITVKEYSSTTFISYNISQNKTFTTPTDNIIFYSLYTRNGLNILLLELGSGKHGKYIPNSQINVKIVKTQGTAGNIGAQSVTAGIQGTIELTDYDSSGQIVHSLSNIVDPNTFLSVNIIEAASGKDPFTGDTLRKNLIEFIQSRNNLLNELDFENVLSKYFKYFSYIFKKINFQDNIIGVYLTFLNRLSQPEFTTCSKVAVSDFTANIIDNKYVFAPVVNINGTDFVSPFLYSYDSLLNLYNAYLIYPELVFNPNYVNSINPQLNQQEPLLQLKLTFDNINIHTNIQLVKIIDTPNTNIKYKITIPLLNIYNQDIVDIYDYPSIITENLLIYIYILDLSDVILYEFKFDNVCLITDFGDFLHLKTYNNYIIDVPLINKHNYESDQIYYLTRFKTQIGSLNLTETRLASDDIQLKFLNTFYLPAIYTKQLTVQQYELDIQFPLVVSINLILERNYITLTNLDVQAALNGLKRTISKYLDSLNAAQFRFYKTAVIDICQNNPWVKDVVVTLKDSVGLDIPNYNIETLSQKDFIKTLTKNDVLNFTPTLFWIDINQLTIDYQFIGD